VHNPKIQTGKAMTTSIDLLLSTPESQAIAAFRGRMAKRYGSRFKGLVLFGSRARRDHRPESDVDIGVILASPIDDLVGEALAMADSAFDILLAHDLHIQPLPIEDGSLEKPEAHPAPHITRRIAAEGIRL
jgi:antitoxin ChpS